jgi:hypothetical protein
MNPSRVMVSLSVRTPLAVCTNMSSTVAGGAVVMGTLQMTRQPALAAAFGVCLLLVTHPVPDLVYAASSVAGDTGPGNGLARYRLFT